MEMMAEKKAFTTLKDHKPDFTNKPSCRLINPAKSEVGVISKQILEKVNDTVRSAMENYPLSDRLVQWTFRPNKPKIPKVWYSGVLPIHHG